MSELGAVSTPTPGTTAKVGFGVAFWVLAAYFFFEYVRPQDRIPVIGSLKIGLLLSCWSIYLWYTRADKSALRERVIRLYIAFLVVIAINIPFATNTHWAYKSTELLTLFLLAGTLPAAAILAEPAKLQRFFQLWIVFHVLIALSSMQRGGRGSGAFLADENDLALALGMALPYAYFMAQAPNVKLKGKVLYLTAAGLLTLGVIMTASRGGFVGLVGCLGAILFLAKHKIRNLLLIAVVALGVLAFVPSSYYAEIESINDPTDSTRKDRLYMWERAWEMYLDNPVIGVGAGNYPWRVHEYQIRTPDFDPRTTRLRGGRVVHSLYFTLLAELGTAGTVLYLAMLIIVVTRLFRVIKAKSDNPAVQDTLKHCSLMARAMLASLATFLLSGAFITVLYYPHFWYLIGFVLALSYCTTRAMQGAASDAHSANVVPETAK